MKKLTYKKAKALVEKQIEIEGADFIYQKSKSGEPGPSCQYVRNGKPDCLVGRVLADFLGGFDEAWNKQGLCYQLLESLEHSGLLTYTDKARDFLSSLQGQQDTGITWGESYRYAVDYVKTSG